MSWYAQNRQQADRTGIASNADEDESQHATTPPEKDQTSAAERAESLPDSAGPTTQNDSRSSAIESSEQVARTLLAEMREKLESGWPTDRDAARVWLNRTLDSDRLVDMDARFLFEWGVAGALAEGWRPGKEFLFSPAIDCFGWREDRGRLVAFGRSGEIVAAALAELEFFDSLPKNVRADQQSLIRRLREDKRPTTSALLIQVPMAERISQLYPHWLHIITNTQNLGQWREWAAQIPKWRQRLARKPRSQPAHTQFEINRWGWGLLLVLAITSLGKIAEQFSSPRSTPPVASYGSFLGIKPPGSSSVSLEAQSSEIDRMLKGLPPNNTADATPTSPRPSPWSEGMLPLERPAIGASYLISPKVTYPPLARRSGQEGSVVLTAVVDPNGKVRHARVERSSGHAILDEAAIAAALDATFVPAKNSEGKAIASTYKIPFNFKLSDDPPPKQSGNRSYGDTVRDAVLPHIVFSEPVSSNPVAEVTLKLGADGSIQSHQLTKPSGNKAWDAAVLRALQRVQRLPGDQNGKVPQEMIIAFRPKA